MMYPIPYVEFYITNVCNLACAGCNRFNNLDFRGWQRWSDWAETYAHWASIIQPRRIGVLGGEPTLNPTLIDWLQGIRALWPRPELKVTTNGTRLRQQAELYEFAVQDPNFVLWISVHNKQHKRDLMAQVQSWLTAPLHYDYDGTNAYLQRVRIQDARGVQVEFEYNWWFHQGALQRSETGALTLHQSNPTQAHDQCHMRECHTFYQGQLYKCGVTAVLPELDRQHPLQLTPAQRTVLEAVSALNYQDSAERQRDFFAQLTEPVPQCSFCPEQYQGQQIWAQYKKDL